tara:strand:- start:603 stop:1313 length:711 start_codon:yes stop_codon:yes gene_type:complete
MFIDGKRIADEDIYLKEDRYDKPKEVQKFLAKIILQIPLSKEASLLDVGCATGEFIYYLKSQDPNMKLYGMDISEKMVLHARKMVKGTQFRIQSILNPPLWSGENFDFVVCNGVLSIFDDIEEQLRNLIMTAAPDGRVLVSDQFNEDPIDLIMRYRRASEAVGEWETGWNCFSQRTIENIARSFKKNVRWHEFRLPFSIDKGEDPMRSWTIKTEKNSHQIVVGTKQMISRYVAEIY